MNTHKTSKLEKLRQRKKTLVGWFLLFVALFYCYWLVATNLVMRDFWDPQYGTKAALLRKIIAKHPGKPVWVLFGSSKIDFGVRPGAVEEWMNQEKSPLLFNFGMAGSDLFRQWISLRRLVRDGFKPQRVGIEITPVLLSNKESMFINTTDLLVRARWDELDEYRRFTTDPQAIRHPWLESRFNPIYENGMRAESQTAPLWRLTPVPFIRHLGDLHSFDQWGWSYKMPVTVTPENFQIAVQNGKNYYAPSMQNFTVADNSWRAMTSILDFCKEQKIDVFLVVMPEPEEFRAMYPPKTLQTMQDFIDKYKNEYGVPVIDARDWISSDKFSDGLHLLAGGSSEFTQRFVREISANPVH